MSKTARVMIVDDEPIYLDLLEGILEDDFHVIRCNSGEECLREALLQFPDIIFLDANMPDMTGYQVCELLKEDPNTTMIKIIFLTSNDLEHERAEGYNSGADDYLTKPIEAVEVIAMVETALAL